MTLQFTFQTSWFSESDEWAEGLPAISEHSTLEVMKKAFAQNKIVVVEHWFYRGSRAPDRLVFDDFNMFEDYLKENGRAGDAIHVFDVTDALKDGNELVRGKCPNERGKTPKKGAY